MKKNLTKQDEMLISVSDFLDAIRKKKSYIKKISVSFAAFGFILALLGPLKYKAEGSFKEKGTQSVSLGSSMQSLLGSMSSENSSTLSVMKSTAVIGDVVKKFNLQATLNEHSRKSTWQNIYNNLKALKAHFFANSFKTSSFDIIKDEDIGINVYNLHYPSRLRSQLDILFTSDNSFFIKTRNGSSKPYTFGDKIDLDDGYFFIEKISSRNLKGAKFTLGIEPLFETSKSIENSLKIARDKKDKSIICIECINPNRYLAKNLVNGVMDSYKDYLNEENKKNIKEQLAYLNLRKNTMDEELAGIMDKHSAHLKNRILEFDGFPEINQEIRFVSDQQGQLKSRAFEINRDIALLKNGDTQDYLYNQNINDRDNLLTELFTRRRKLQNEYDLLLLSFKEERLQASENHLELLNHFSFINKQEDKINAIDIFLNNIGNSKNPIDYLDYILKSSLVPDFFKQDLNENNYNLIHQTDLKRRSSALSNYLLEEKKILKMQVDILKSKWLKQKDENISFFGLNLESAEELAKNFAERRNETLVLLDNYLIAENQLENPSLEITALGSLLASDSVAQTLIGEAAGLQKKLFDTNNLSNKEHERLKSEISVRKNFLKNHVEQVKIAAQQENFLLQKKIAELKKYLMSIYQEEIAVINNQLDSYKNSKYLGLKEEESLIDSLLIKLNQQISKLPEQLMSEKKITTAIEAQIKVIEEVSKAVEAKNLSGNISKSESSPLDLASLPVLPQKPPVLLYSLAGLFMGLMYCVGGQMIKVLFGGVIASKANLEYMGYNVGGSLNNYETDLSVVRKLVSFIPQDCKTLSCFNFKGAGYAGIVANLFVKKGKKVILLDLTFLDKNHLISKDENHLIHYVENLVKPIKFHRLSSGYDYLYGGPYCEFGVEIIQKLEFSSLLEVLKKQYDIIIFALPLKVSSFEADLLKDLSDVNILALDEEKLHDIKNFFDQEKNESMKNIFVFNS
jgi:uncharacterized protein involved in exopolysaccharide biosynthesis